MTLALLAIGFLALLSLSYRLYGGFVARRVGLDDARPTPAVSVNDGVDYVPTRPFYLFAQHFSAIAAAGPIAGPILACQAFGWLPCLLWIGFGVVFIGAVHDFTALAASVRHGARSIAEIAREHLGTGAGRAFLVFIWIALVYVIVAFADITAGTFVEGGEELAGVAATFHKGGAVAAASAMYLALALVLGAVQRWLRPPLWLVTLIFVPATFGVAWLGTRCSGLVLGHGAWVALILVYCGAASITPVWALLQPRGYLGGFVLYAALAMGVIGVLFGGYEIQQPAFKTWDNGTATGALFPFLFVTIACGACSGFHGLVCSGTTSKQVARESHMRVVGYGAMLAEAFVALIALVTVMVATSDELVAADGRPLAAGTIYGQGIGRFLTLVIGAEHERFAVTFGAMAFSTFVFDTIDVTTRLGRYIVQELTGWRGRAGALAGTIGTLALPALFLALATADSYKLFWTLFGASNQLLAALTLTTVTVWMHGRSRKSLFTLLPMVFVFSITIWALARLFLTNVQATQGLDIFFVNALGSCAFVVLAAYLAIAALRRLRV